MSNRFLKVLLPILSISVFGHADEAPCEQKPAPKKKEFIQYHNRMIVFAPFHQGYERIKPDAIYVGLEGYLAQIVNHGDNNNLLDAEFRMGYNFFFNGRDHLTPLAGIGYLKDFYRHNHREYHRPGIVYGTVGLIYDHEFNTIFSLGFTAKLLVGGPVNEKRFNWGSPVVGADTSLMLTFRFGYKRHWDYRIEPFNMYLHGSNSSEDYWGFRNSLAYRF